MVLKLGVRTANTYIRTERSQFLRITVLRLWICLQWTPKCRRVAAKGYVKTYRTPLQANYEVTSYLQALFSQSLSQKLVLRLKRHDHILVDNRLASKYVLSLLPLGHQCGA